MGTEVEYDKRLMKYVIDRVTPFSVMLDHLGHSYSDTHNMFCPFHDNENTPSARLYHDEEGDRLFCYAENKMYYPSDVITRGLVDLRLETVFMKIWNQLDSSFQEELITQYGKPIDIVPQKWKDNEELLNQFKKGNVTISEFQRIVIDLLS